MKVNIKDIINGWFNIISGGISIKESTIIFYNKLSKFTEKIKNENRSNNTNKE